MPIAIATMLVLGLLLVMLSKESDDFLIRGLIRIAGVAFVVLSTLMAYDLGTGKPCNLPLDENAIYETVSSAPDNGKYAVILREQDGDLVAYLLDKNPPKMFKVTGNDAKTFEPFPPVPPTPAVPPKK